MEQWLALGGGIRVCVSRTHRFGTDAVLLADFARPAKRDVACDLGTGCGIVPLLWCRTDAPASVTAVDLQPDAVALLTRSVAENGLQARLTPLCADLRALPAEMTERFTLVTVNPPYQPVQTGAVSASAGRRLARQEIACTLQDTATAAARLLKPGGRFCLCLRPERLTDALVALRSVGVEPKRLRFVCAKPDVAPNLFLLEGKKQAKPGLRIEPALTLTDASGADSPALRAIYAGDVSPKEVHG